MVSQSGGGRLGVWPGEHRTLPPLLPVAWPLRLLYSPDVMRHHPHLPVQLGTLFWQRLGGSQGSVTGGILVSTVRLPPPSPTLLWAAAFRYTISSRSFLVCCFWGTPRLVARTTWCSGVFGLLRARVCTTVSLAHAVTSRSLPSIPTLRVDSRRPGGLLWAVCVMWVVGWARQCGGPGPRRRAVESRPLFRKRLGRDTEPGGGGEVVSCVS